MKKFFIIVFVLIMNSCSSHTPIKIFKGPHSKLLPNPPYLTNVEVIDTNKFINYQNHKIDSLPKPIGGYKHKVKQFEIIDSAYILFSINSNRNAENIKFWHFKKIGVDLSATINYIINDTKFRPAYFNNQLIETNVFIRMIKGNYDRIPLDSLKLISYPLMLFLNKPDYPRIPKQTGLEGEVEVMILVDTSGNVEKVAIGKSSGIVALDESAAWTALKNKYKPAMVENQPISMWTSYIVKFSSKRNTF